jgi:hypothetical protein
VNLSIYNMKGALVEQLIDEYVNAGQYEQTWDASYFASGVYVCVMKVNDNIVGSEKITLLK